MFEGNWLHSSSIPDLRQHFLVRPTFVILSAHILSDLGSDPGKSSFIRLVSPDWSIIFSTRIRVQFSVHSSHWKTSDAGSGSLIFLLISIQHILRSSVFHILWLPTFSNGTPKSIGSFQFTPDTLFKPKLVYTKMQSAVRYTHIMMSSSSALRFGYFNLPSKYFQKTVQSAIQPNEH